MDVIFIVLLVFNETEEENEGNRNWLRRGQKIYATKSRGRTLYSSHEISFQYRKSRKTIKSYTYHLKLYFEFLEVEKIDYQQINLHTFSSFIGWL